MDRDGDTDICVFISINDEKQPEMNKVVWIENPGVSTDKWEPHSVGLTEFHGDKVIPSDVNGDGRLDLVVTEELWPGLEPDANMYWFEAPEDSKYWNWVRHDIVTQYSMNNLDVADLDLDGDPDIVTCEHKGPNEKLQIWENNGYGHFREHLIDQGKESHAGARLSDLDQDGDLDIISIAWNDFQYLHVWRNDAVMGNSTGHAGNTPLGLDVTNDYKYYIPVKVEASENDFANKPVEINLDLKELQEAVGEPEGIDPWSVRVIEVDKNGDLIDGTVVYQFDPDAEKALGGNLVFLIKDQFREGTIRYFRILYGPLGGYYVKPVFHRQVHCDDWIRYKEQPSIKIKTQNATYFYHKNGAGFASMIDNAGNDWISYRHGGGSAGEYRGIPNIRPAGFHPGHTNLNSRILHEGPLKLTIYSETEDKNWRCTWEMYPGYATMTLLEKSSDNYWLLYEGTPAGKLDVDRDFWVRSDGTKLSVRKDWTGDLPDPEWVYFGDENCSRVLFLAKHENDNKPDQFWQMQGNMTVLGFGRKPNEDPGTYLTDVPVHMTIGFVEDTEYEQIIKVIRSTVECPLLSIGKPQEIH